MPENSNNQEVSKTNNIFPISPESAENTLNKISRNSEEEFTDELFNLSFNNPELKEGLLHLAKNSEIESAGFDSEEFKNGYLSAYKFIRENARGNGRELPQTTQEQWMIHNIRDLAKNKLNFQGSEDDFVEDQLKKIGKRDEEFEKGIRELVKDKNKENKFSFYKGAVNVYLALKKADESQKLEEKFDMR